MSQFCGAGSAVRRRVPSLPEGLPSKSKRGGRALAWAHEQITIGFDVRWTIAAMFRCGFTESQGVRLRDCLFTSFRSTIGERWPELCADKGSWRVRRLPVDREMRRRAQTQRPACEFKLQGSECSRFPVPQSLGTLSLSLRSRSQSRRGSRFAVMRSRRSGSLCDDRSPSRRRAESVTEHCHRRSTSRLSERWIGGPRLRPALDSWRGRRVYR
jgi:hypothetical protein